MSPVECRRRDACPYAAHRGHAQVKDAAAKLRVCAAIPDVEEEWMLRALVLEGAALAYRGPFFASFHGYCVRVSRDGRCGARCTRPIIVEIRCRHGELLERTCLFTCDPTNEAAGR